jgi:heptosyltransferase-1
MRVLVVKVSSLGDVIHTLPALTDARKAIPDIEFDWVVEEAFTEIPAWHPAVNKVIPVAFRRWRKNLFSLFFSSDFRRFKRELRGSRYDLVIDAQGLLKSAVICGMVPARTVGFDQQSIREKLAVSYYDESHAVSWQQHAVERTRELFAHALGYSKTAQADYGIPPADFSEQVEPSGRFLLFLHGTTWPTKLWPESYWQELTRLATENDFQVKLLWGNEEEKSRAQQIAGLDPKASVIDRQALSAIAKLMYQSAAIVAVDTGLAHLAAALGRPTLALYGASDAKRTGTYGENQKHLQARLPCSPCLKRQCDYRGDELEDDEKAKVFAVQPPCFSTLSPQHVWQELTQLLVEFGKN